MAAKTKTELEKEIKGLKSQIRELRADVKSNNAELKDLTNTAIGVILVEGEFLEVEIAFNLDKKSAIIVNSKSIGRNIGMASSKLKMGIVDELVKVTKG